MIGVPEIRTHDSSPDLLISGLEFAPETRQFHPVMAEHLSLETRNKLNELLARQQESNCYQSFLGDDRLAWGVREAEAEPVSLGAIGLSGAWDDAIQESLLPGWCQAESWLAFFDPASGGRGIATRAYQHMICAGLDMGLDAIHAAVRPANIKSAELHKRCGFVALGTFLRNDREYIDFRLFNPLLGKRAVDYAMAEAGRRINSGVRMADVDQSLREISALRKRLAYVNDAVIVADAWRPFIATLAA